VILILLVGNYMDANEDGWVMLFNATFNNISVILWWCFIGGGNQSIQRKP
jgi:hypothetical protein